MLKMKICSYKILPLYLITIFISITSINCSGCKHDKYDLSLLNRLFISKTDDTEDFNITYKINLCSPLVSTDCHANTSVCMIYSNGTTLSAGNFTGSLPGGTNAEAQETWVILVGDTCPSIPAHNMTTSINFKCGPLMGAPKFLDFMMCTTYFEWESHVFCNGTDKPVKEVPCYIYDQENRYDLSPLALGDGGYLVSSQLDTDIYINVCRDIKAVGATSGCPPGVAACRKSGNTFLGLGQPKDELKKDSSDGLILKYTSLTVEKSLGCTSPSSTTIFFRCPKRGGSKDPLVVQDFDCQYLVEWVTEYACPEVILSNNTCVLTKSEADIDIDLRALTKTPGSHYPFKVEVKDTASNETYWYFLNVCGELNLPCPGENQKNGIAVCQKKASNANFGHSLGHLDHVQFRYADGDLTLTYKGGEPCGLTNLQRQTIIQFICEWNATDRGIGVPAFDHEDGCIYFFMWKTKYACLDHPIDEQCRVGYNGQLYDLSSLVRTSGTNFIALHDIDYDSGRGQYFINVCHNIQQEGLASKCDPGAAICYREGLHTQNLGRYENKPTYDNTTSTIQIRYTNGDVCVDNKRKSSTITFICKPGDLQSAPVLTYKSNDACFYDFEWHTAAACPLGHYKGDNCKVYNEEAGFTIDLSRLTKATSYYIATDGNHDYLLNVCGPVNKTKCDKLGIPNVGICQVPAKNSSGDAFVTGQFNSMLHYFDGMINLTYTEGSKYNDNNHTPRKSQIAFLCDQDAGVGTPRYLSEIASDHYYAFEWRTAYACADVPMECTATDEKSGQEYDLSSLSMTADQGNHAVRGESNTRYYINVCRSLSEVAVGKGCGAFAAVCRTNFNDGKESIDIPDMGRVKSDLEIEGEGRLKLVYKGPSTCNNETSLVPYVVKIIFICTKDAVISAPDSPMNDGPCEYTILWNTAAACPLSKDDDIQDCTAKNPSTNYIFNLKPLRRPDNDPYTVTAGDLTFKLNICGNLSQLVCNDIAAVCQISKAGNKTILAYASSLLDFSGTSNMFLQYSGALLESGQRVRVQINFECAPAIDLGRLEFIKQEGNSYFFQFYTALACAPMGTDCIIQDENGNQYDLTSLARNDFWAVSDTRDESMKYYINVCRPVNNVSNSNCSDAPIGGCQTLGDGKAYNIGYIQSKPVAHVNGSVMLQYRNGDICQKNTPYEANRNMRINFFCSETEAGPAFETETITCEYIFNWKTPAACPLKTSNGTNCKVVDPRFGHQFDLSPLRKAGTDYHVVQDEYEYIINVCGPLEEKGSCGASLEVGACQTKHGVAGYSPVDAGNGNSNLVYSNGELTLTYTGSRSICNGLYKRQTIIKFICDQSTTGDKGPIFIDELFNCHYVFKWSTSYACPPFKVASCSVTSGHDHYDLSSLTLLDNNYAFIDSIKHKRYVLNVCRSLIHQPDALCPYNAASCVIDLTKKDTDPDKYKNIGEPNSEQVIFDNNRLVLVYTNGDMCSNGIEHMTTHVMFICDDQVKVSSPAGHFMVGQCDHHFMWVSAAACKLGTADHDGDKIVDAGNITCTVTNPRTGYKFDLSSLKILSGSPYKVTDNDNHNFQFNVCGPVKNSLCAPTTGNANIGVCQSEVTGAKRVFNAGNAVHNLWYNDGVIIQNFTGGDKCHNGSFERNTIISFVCNGHGGLGKPVFMGETDDCDYFITWSTSIVCDDEVKCSVDTNDDHTLDLSSLAIEPNHMVRSPVDGSIFYLSVCKPLMPMQGVLCPAGAGICLVKPVSGKMHESLGKVRSSPKFDNRTKDVILEYTDGSQCDTNISAAFTTRIIFSCVRGLIRSNPIFVLKTDCVYEFQWKTALVCYDAQSVTPASSDVCGYNDSLHGDYYNLTLLKKNSPYQVKDQKTNNTYYVSMCGSVQEPSSCGLAMVCRQDGMSFGEPKNFTFVKTQGMLEMNYAPGRLCIGTNTAESRIIFKCDRNVNFGQPEFLSGFDCDVQFLWKTSYVCPRIVNPCSAYIEGKFYDLSILSRQKGAWNITDTDKNIYWINICTGIHDPSLIARGCSSNAGSCMQSKGSDRVNTLSTVDAQSNLHFDSKVGAVVLEYGHVQATCSSSTVTTDNGAAKTKINFICGSTIGAPTFVNSESNAAQCIFEFNWKTKLACEIKRENVAVTDGIVKDPRTGTSFTLQHLWNISYNYDENLDAGSVNTYTILLNGSANGCVNSTICQLKNKQHRSLGYISTAEFNIDDDMLEVTYTTNEVCGDHQIKQNVTSIIQFTCSTEDTPPKLLYQQYDCVYFFTWETMQACLSPVFIETSKSNTSHKSESEQPNLTHYTVNASKGGGGMSTKAIAGMVATFLGIIIICIFMVVFHKPERRAACISSIQGLFTIRRKSYSQLPAEDDFMGEMEDEIVTIQDAAGRDLENVTPLAKVDRPLTSYHDDSDEDMLT